MSQKTIPAKKPRTTAASSRATATRSKRKKASVERSQRTVVSRATAGYDDDDFLLSGGAMPGAGFGRCGGRALSSRIEQTLCDKLSRAGVTHSHSPRHFEVRVNEKEVAAYAPMVVLRGRGREGKTVVIEAAAEIDKLTLSKVAAFRDKFGIEFYVIFVAPEDVIDEIPLATYDESCTTTDLDTLVSRLAD